MVLDIGGVGSWRSGDGLGCGNDDDGNDMAVIVLDPCCLAGRR